VPVPSGAAAGVAALAAAAAAAGVLARLLPAAAAGIGHSLLSYSSTLRGISKLQLDEARLHQVGGCGLGGDTTPASFCTNITMACQGFAA
jgi:hypothetical protein